MAHSATTSSARMLLAESLRDFRRNWPLFIAADFMARIVALVVLTPLLGLLLRQFLRSTANGVLTDVAIATFLLHPVGMAALVICGAFLIAVLFAEISQIMVIEFGSVRDSPTPLLSSLKRVYGRSPAILEFAGCLVLRVLLLAAPFAAVLAAVCWGLLSRYDINYYVKQQPWQFLLAATAGGGLLIAFAVLVIRKLSSWLVALPMVLFEGCGGRQALRASERATAPHRRRLAGWLAAWIAAPLILSALTHLVIACLADNFIPRDGSHLTFVILWLGGLLLLDGLVQFAIAVGLTILFSIFVVRLHKLLAPRDEQHSTASTETVVGVPAAVRRRSVALCSAAALVLTVVGVYLFWQKLDWRTDCLIIGHRGGTTAAPENTLAAFGRGIADGADWLELDVQEDADGEVIVVHDRDFMRLAHSDRQVHQITGTELRDLDVGSHAAREFADQRVPTLRQVLELAKGHVGLFIELKYYGHNRSLEEKVVHLVESAGMTPSVVVMSLDYDGVRRTAAIRPDWTFGLLNAVSVGDLTHLDLDFLALAAKAASRSTIRRAHDRGMKVYAWTINDPVQMWVMMSRGVDGIITDRVALARRVQELRARFTPLGRFVVWMAGETGLLRGRAHSSGNDEA